MNKIGVTCGSFDYIIHDGHLSFLSKCKQLCDILHVALVADETIRKNKNRESYYCQEQRAFHLFDTGLVNGVIFLKDTDSGLSLLQCNPNIYILGKDQWNNFWSQESAFILFNYGVSIVSTFERLVVTTTELLIEIGYIVD